MTIQEIRSGNEKVDAYIVSLEEHLMNLEASNIYRLIKECDQTSGILADDVRILREEKDDEALESRLLLLGSRRNKRFEAFLALVAKVKDLKGISDMLEAMRPKKALKEAKTEEPIEEDTTPSVKKKTNIQHFVNNG